MGLYSNLRIEPKNVGKKYGIWTQVGPQFRVRTSEVIEGYRRFAVCQCKCGNVEAICTKHLSGKLLRNEHCHKCHPDQYVGKERRLEYQTWAAMRCRCLKKEHRNYPLYGGRGVTICERWDSFENFYADMGPRPTRTSQIDRIDNSKGYSPDNCRWASRIENCRNKTNNNRMMFNGELLTVAEIVERTGTHRVRFWCRVTKMGWTPEDAALKPSRRERPKA